jgi:hypothetical protein
VVMLWVMLKCVNQGSYVRNFASASLRTVCSSLHRLARESKWTRASVLSMTELNCLLKYRHALCKQSTADK